ncbi:hypothetical protein NRS6186_03405 [Bacillus subtilis]|nr:hypothetical protein BSP4_11000 [Bacillus subtilis subsp. subtilis]TWG53497.1 hypothetical protein L608_000400002590 [Bacillus subtilis J23]TWG67068.1 hypothetical protein L606_000400000020 [Bacillus subtilis J25]TWH26477.1 hypothetical protein L609_000500002570 [Bacillus subtilis J22]CAF1760780.1 hypothetical protein NRS6099_03262 [Bacillus subtilis]
MTKKFSKLITVVFVITLVSQIVFYSLNKDFNFFSWNFISTFIVYFLVLLVLSFFTMNFYNKNK